MRKNHTPLFAFVENGKAIDWWFLSKVPDKSVASNGSKPKGTIYITSHYPDILDKFSEKRSEINSHVACNFFKKQFNAYYICQSQKIV